MSLLIPDYQDPQDAPGTTLPDAYAWIPEVTISYADATARFTLWVHRGADAAATWPDGGRVPRAHQVAIYCGAEVVGYPGVVFPELDAVMARAAEVAATWMAAATTDEERSAVLASVATGGAIRAALYALLRELVFPGATEVE